MSQFFKVLLCHSPKEDGKYKQMETVYHLHDDLEGFDNHRCTLTEDGRYFCPGCQQIFSKEEVNRYPHRDLPKNKSYWLESRRSGQHLPHNEKDIFWAHVHPQDNRLKRKTANVDSIGLFATCPDCEKTLNLHTWQESDPHSKQLLFPGIVWENVPIPIWKEIKIFLKEAVKIWLQDKDGNFFFLNEQLQLLPAENQDGILVCGEHLFLDNDDRKCLIFQVDETLSQALIDKNLKESSGQEEDFHSGIKMDEEYSSIPQKPESRHRPGTQELASGELTGITTDNKRESSQEIIVIVDEVHAETHKIPKHHKVDLNEATPLPKDAHPLLIPEPFSENKENANPNDLDDDSPKMVITIEQAEASGLLRMPDSTNEPKITSSEAPTAVVSTVPEDAPMELVMTETPTTNGDTQAEMPAKVLESVSTMLLDGEIVAAAPLLTGFTPDEDKWFASMEENSKDEASSEPNITSNEAPTTAVSTVPEDAPTELVMTTDVDNATPANDKTLAKLAEAEVKLNQAEALIDQLLRQDLVSGTIHTSTTDIANEPNITSSEAPTAVVSTVPDASAKQPGASRHCWECQQSLPAGEACPDHEKICPTCGLTYLISEQVCRKCQPEAATLPTEKDSVDKPEVIIKESENTSPSDAPSPQPIPVNKKRQCIICGKILQSSPVTGEEVCDEHEKSCFICATVNPKEAVFCGGCGSPFIKKASESPAPEKKTRPASPHREALLKTGLALAGICIIMLITAFFAWMNNYFQSEELQTELRAAEKRWAELNTQINKLRVEVNLIHMNLLATKRDAKKLHDTLPELQEKQSALANKQADLENRFGNVWTWQAEVQKFFVKAKNKLQVDFAQLKDEARNDRLAWQKQERERSETLFTELRTQVKNLSNQQSLFAKTWENKLKACTKPKDAPVAPKNLFGGEHQPDSEKPMGLTTTSFLAEILPALLHESVRLAKKYQAEHKAPPTLLVDKTPPPPTPPQTAQKPAKTTPPAVDKSPKDKNVASVDKSKNPQKSTEKTSKNPQKTHSFEAKDLVHIWTGPTYF